MPRDTNRLLPIGALWPTSLLILEIREQGLQAKRILLFGFPPYYRAS